MGYGTCFSNKISVVTVAGYEKNLAMMMYNSYPNIPRTNAKTSTQKIRDTCVNPFVSDRQAPFHLSSLSISHLFISIGVMSLKCIAQRSRVLSLIRIHLFWEELLTPDTYLVVGISHVGNHSHSGPVGKIFEDLDEASTTHFGREMTGGKTWLEPQSVSNAARETRFKC